MRNEYGFEVSVLDVAKGLLLSTVKAIFLREHDCTKDGHSYGDYETLRFGFTIPDSRAIGAQFKGKSPIPVFKDESKMRRCTSCGFFDFADVEWVK